MNSLSDAKVIWVTEKQWRQGRRYGEGREVQPPIPPLEGDFCVEILKKGGENGPSLRTKVKIRIYVPASNTQAFQPQITSSNTYLGNNILDFG